MKELVPEKTRGYFKYIFIGLVLLDIMTSSFGHSDFRILSKPLILISLLVYFIASGQHLGKIAYLLTILALFCSLLGDVFLLFETQGSLFFTLGLASFLTAHIIYVLIFLKKQNTKPSISFWWITLILFRGQ